MLFEKPSLRTRSTFEVAILELGGHPLDVPSEFAGGSREPIEDVARNLERWVHGLVVRTYAQEKVETFARSAQRMPVINALTNEHHPLQALADVMTMRERWGRTPGRTVAYVGDGNNVATSLAHAACMAGISVHVATPDGYELPQTVIDEAAAGRERRCRNPLLRGSAGGGRRRGRHLRRRVGVDGRREQRPTHAAWCSRPIR